jgi:hypothetical protein
MVPWDNAVGAGATLTSEALSTTCRDLATDGARVFWLAGDVARADRLDAGGDRHRADRARRHRARRVCSMA